MTTSTADYLPTASEAESFSPGSLASKQAWQTAKDRAVAETRKSPYELREQCCLCNDANLTDFAKLLFCRLTDMAFKDAFKRGDGVVACSKKFLSDDFDCSVDTVTRATRVLERSGFLWTKTVWNGSFEITWWFIREWADDKREYSPHSGSNFGRRFKGVQRNTARNDSGKFTANPDSKRQKIIALLTANGHANGNGSTVKAGISPDHGDKSALTGQESQPCQGRTVSLDHGQESALTGQTNQPCHGAAVGPDTVQPSALTRQTNQPCQVAPLPGLTTLQDDQGDLEEDSFKRSTEFNAQKEGRGRKAPSRENLFLLDVAAEMEKWKKGTGKTEMASSGAWWRLAYRKDWNLISRVLADTTAAIREKRIKQTPGQHAVDLWQRWGGGSVALEAGR